MKYLLETMKIVEGALNADRSKVLSYVQLLADRFEGDGDSTTAARIRRLLNNAKLLKLEQSDMSNSRLPVDSESRLALADECFPGPDEHPVVLPAAVQRVVDEFLQSVKHADKFLQQGMDVSPSLLLYGPPGCGKTELALNIAGQLRLPILVARTDSLISSYLGSTAKNLRRLFDHAVAHPCILFLDEFDAVAKLRDDEHELGELKRVVVSVLQNIDALDNKTVLIAATNHEHLLDSAIWRRFTFKAHLTKPGEVARARLFQQFSMDFSSPEIVEAFARLSDGLTGAEIRQMAESAIRAAVLHDRLSLDEKDIMLQFVRLRLPNFDSETVGMKDKLQAVRDLDPKFFVLRRLASLFDISDGHASRLLNRK